MESWHHSLAGDLFVPALTGHPIDDAAELEIAFGHARAALVYVLELARAHRLAAAGNASGDAIWLQLGHGRVRFTLNRRDAHIVVRSLQAERKVWWDAVARSIVMGGAGGAPCDLRDVAQKTIHELVVAFREHPLERLSTAPRELEDEPTKS